jgi:hypothetical protein
VGWAVVDLAEARKAGTGNRAAICKKQFAQTSPNNRLTTHSHLVIVSP